MDPLISPTQARRGSGGGAPPGKGLSIAFLVILCATALVDRIWPVAEPRLVGQEKAEYVAAQRQRSLRDGSLARWIDKDYAARSRTRVLLAPWWSIVMFALGDSMKRDVVAGSDGWLFLRRRAEFSPEALREAPAVAANTLLALRRRLALHGCDLCCVPIPRKAAACWQRLPHGFPPHAEFDAEIIARLRDGGAPTIDLLAAWAGLPPEDLYMRLDTHWEVGAQEAAARAIARAFKDLPGDRPGDQQGELGAVDLTRTQEPGPAALLRFAGFHRGHPAWDHLNTVPLNRVRFASPELAEALSKPGATGTASREIALLGTSFTQHLALHPLLVSELRAPVKKVASDGAAFTQPIELLLDRWSEVASLPGVLILEFPVYQVISARNRHPSVTRAIGSIVQKLDLGAGMAQELPAEALYRDARNAGRQPQLRASLRPGSLLSSGDGVVQLRVEVAADQATDWNVRTAAMDLPLHFGPGGGVAWVPLIEGVDWQGHVRVFSKNAAAHAAKITIQPAVDSGAGVLLRGTARSEAGPTPVQEIAELHAAIRTGDVLLVDWSSVAGAPRALSIVLSGSRDGEHKEATWTFPMAIGTWAVLNLAPFAGGKLDRVRVRGIQNPIHVRTLQLPALR